MTDHRGIDATTIVIKTQVLTTISTKTLVTKAIVLMTLVTKTLFIMAIVTTTIVLSSHKLVLEHVIGELSW